jgi:hypothetical protein
LLQNCSYISVRHLEICELLLSEWEISLHVCR